MKYDEKKAVLTQQDLLKVKNACREAEKEYLKPENKQANVVGLGAGVKWKNGAPTGEPAVIVLVTQKLEKDQVPAADRIPERLGEIQTDVLSIGIPYAGEKEIQDTKSLTLTGKIRPAKGGFSIGHEKVTAGTMATAVYDVLPEGSISPPVHGEGIPSKYYLLSNNHVIANNNDAKTGDPILQPGPFDGGAAPYDTIARLSRFVPIEFEPEVPRQQHENLVDAAIAEGDFHELDREIYWSGGLRGWYRKSDVRVGMPVKKTGRTTNFSTGRITVVDATVDVNFDEGRIARFKDQIITTPMSAGGDSGSLVTSLGNAAVGLLFAGSPSATIVNQIENVRRLLRVEVAETVVEDTSI